MDTAARCESLESPDSCAISALNDEIAYIVEKIERAYKNLCALVDAHDCELGRIKRQFMDSYESLTKLKQISTNCHKMSREIFEYTMGEFSVKGVCNGISITIESLNGIPFDSEQFELKFPDSDSSCTYGMRIDYTSKITQKINIFVVLQSKISEVIDFAITYCGTIIHNGKFVIDKDHTSEHMESTDIDFYVQILTRSFSIAKCDQIRMFSNDVAESVRCFQKLNQTYKNMDMQMVEILSKIPKKITDMSPIELQQLYVTDYLEECREKLYLLNGAYLRIIKRSTFH